MDEEQREQRERKAQGQGQGERKERADAARNREAVLTAADALFARSRSPRSVSMDDIAAAAGVGKGTLFRRFGDRAGLVRALFEARIGPLREAVETGPAPLGPGGPPRERVLAVLDAVVRFKLQNRHLSLALEEDGAGSPYQAAHYAWWHATLAGALRGIPRSTDSDFTAHALLAATRADLVEHLFSQEDMSADQIRAHLAAFAAKVLDADPVQSVTHC
ncbi:TetR/AcrR family transcriptional regulator [Streptomyces sp. FIT100]|uniref:TetR/AcrR family transcriptional regulator n=1 Tax=Streptomyces sp. FIT100 TaxID=2837956 RepID=UPI0021C9D9F7|nr:TetR/AcrR family transcriptional regulator [Streptomyces sp. FIT100]UUN27491.1 TetR/AcrR family transcriptional regulator [Streptomyces sp. FIT100]